MRLAGQEKMGYYPTPLSQQVAFGRGCFVPNRLVHTDHVCGEVLSLPICPFLSLDDLENVVHELTSCCAKLTAVLSGVAPGDT